MDLSDYNSQILQSQLSQGLMGRRHSVDSNIGRSRPPTFVRTYREVKWKRVNTPTRPLQVAQPSKSLDPCYNSNERDVECREYITGTHIIRQRVPIFMASNDPPSMTGRRFSAGDLIPVTGSDLHLAPNGKCLVIRDVLPRKLSLTSSNDDARSSSNTSFSSGDIRWSLSSSCQRLHIDDHFDVYDFSLIDEDEEDITEDGSDEDEEEEKVDSSVMYHSCVGKSTSGDSIGSSESSPSSTLTVSLSSSTQKMGAPKLFDLRRLALENSIQLKTKEKQPGVMSSMQRHVTNAPPAVSTQEIVMPIIQQSSIVHTVNRAVMTPVTTQSPLHTATQTSSVPTSPKPTPVSTLVPIATTTADIHAVRSINISHDTAQYVAPSIDAHSKSVTSGLLIQHDGQLCNAPEALCHHLSFTGQPDVARRPEPGETSWVRASTKIAGTNVYVTSYTPHSSKMSVRSANWISPRLVEGTIPIDMKEAKATRVDLVAVPTNSGGEPLMFQRLTYSSGYICCSAQWITPTDSTLHTSRSLNTRTSSSMGLGGQPTGLYHNKKCPPTSRHTQVSGTGSLDVLPSAISHKKPGQNSIVGKVSNAQLPYFGMSDLPLSMNPTILANVSKGIYVTVTVRESDRSSQAELVPSVSSFPLAEKTITGQPTLIFDRRNASDNFSTGTDSRVLSSAFTQSLKWATQIKENVPDGNLNVKEPEGKSMHVFSSHKNVSASEDNLTIATHSQDKLLSRRRLHNDLDSLPQHRQREYTHTHAQPVLPRVLTRSPQGIYPSPGALHSEKSITDNVAVMAAADSCHLYNVACPRYTYRGKESMASRAINRLVDNSSCSEIRSQFVKRHKLSTSIVEHNVSPVTCQSASQLSPDISSECHSNEHLYLLEKDHAKRSIVEIDTVREGRLFSERTALIDVILKSIPDSTKRVSIEDDRSCGGSTVAIDNKIEQAMDLVKRHLMYAVREEVEILKQQIGEMIERIGQLEYENSLLRSEAKPETLNKLQQPRAAHISQTSSPGQNVSVVSAANLQQLQQTTPPLVSQSEQTTPPLVSHPQQTIPPTVSQPSSSQQEAQLPS